MPQKSQLNQFNNTQKQLTPLSIHVKEMVEQYFFQLNGYEVSNLYGMVIREVEKPLIEATLDYCNQNQTKTAQILGLSRSTLRRKIELYDLS